MSNLNRIMFLIGLCFVFSTPTYALNCNPNKELSPESLKSVGGKVDAKKFKESYDKLYAAQEKAISAFTKANPKDKNPRDNYFKTPTGLKSFNELDQLRISFGYNSISRFMFDDSELNSDSEFYSEIKIQGSKRYYLSGDRVIATVESVSKDNIKLIRYDKTCKGKEVVSFKDNNAQANDLISYQVNPKYCDATAGGKNTISDDQRTALEAFIDEVESAQKFKQNSEIQNACLSFKSTTTGSSPVQNTPASSHK